MLVVPYRILRKFPSKFCPSQRVRANLEGLTVQAIARDLAIFERGVDKMRLSRIAGARNNKEVLTRSWHTRHLSVCRSELSILLPKLCFL